MYTLTIDYKRSYKGSQLVQSKLFLNSTDMIAMEVKKQCGVGFLTKHNILNVASNLTPGGSFSVSEGPYTVTISNNIYLNLEKMLQDNSEGTLSEFVEEVVDPAIRRYQYIRLERGKFLMTSLEFWGNSDLLYREVDKAINTELAERKSKMNAAGGSLIHRMHMTMLKNLLQKQTEKDYYTYIIYDEVFATGETKEELKKFPIGLFQYKYNPTSKIMSSLSLSLFLCCFDDEKGVIQEAYYRDITALIRNLIVEIFHSIEVPVHHLQTKLIPNFTPDDLLVRIFNDNFKTEDDDRCMIGRIEEDCYIAGVYYDTHLYHILRSSVIRSKAYLDMSDPVDDDDEYRDDAFDISR